MNADKELLAPGLACVNLTPDIKKAISAMQANEMLKFINEDTTSRLGVKQTEKVNCKIGFIHAE